MKRIYASILFCLTLAHFIGGKPPAAVSAAPIAVATLSVAGPAIPIFQSSPRKPTTALPPVEDILAWAGRDPAAAGAWLKNRPDDEIRQQALAAVIRHWLRLDPRAAADFALTLPDARARAQALDQVACAWVARDPVAASVWAESLPATPELDTFAAAIATIPELVSSQLDTSLSWAETIANEELRTQTLGVILDIRAARDPAANIYLVTTPRPATAQKTLLASAR